jgi:hypothetical protein
MITTNPLHHHFFIDEVRNLKNESGLRFGDTTVLTLQGRDIDGPISILFHFGIPSMDHIVRITSYPTEHPDRRNLDHDIRSKLFGKSAGGALTSLRQEEGLSVSINSGLGGTEPYLAILFNDQCYRVTREYSELVQLHPPRGNFSFPKNSSQEQQLLSSLPDFSDLIRLDGSPVEKIQRGLPHFSSTLHRILREEGRELAEERTLYLYLPKPVTPDPTPLIPDLVLLSFSIDRECKLKHFCIVGSEGLFYEPYTFRAENKVLGL